MCANYRKQRNKKKAAFLNGDSIVKNGHTLEYKAISQSFIMQWSMG